MATLKYYDPFGSSTAYSLIGESGYLPLNGIVGDYARYTITWEDNGSKLTQKFNLGNLLAYSFQYTYTNVISPAPDKRISLISQYNNAGILIASISGLDLSLKEAQQKSSLPVFQGEDSVEGNASNNYLQGALGDDVLVGLAGNDTLDGGRADDTLVGGAGNDTLYGGLGTDYAAFSSAAANYTYSFSSDGSLSINDKTFTDGIDKLIDVEWLLFDYGKSTQSRVLVSQLKYETIGYSLITGYAQVNTADTIKFPSPANLVVEGNYWTFKSDARILSWALADNGTYTWPNKDTIQDIIGGALEEFSKLANINFQYIGAYSTLSSAKNSGADFVYTLNDQGTGGAIAYAFFPNYSDKTVNYNYRVINPAYTGNSFVEFLSFVTIHETGHALGLKHPHDASALNKVKVYPSSTTGDDGLSTLLTMMSYYNPSGFYSASSFYPTTPMLLDTVALMALYGAPNYREATGNTTYSIITKNSYQTFVDYSGKNIFDASTASNGWYLNLADDGKKISLGYSLKSIYSNITTVFGTNPNTQTIVGAGLFSDAVGTAYDDTIIGTVNANNISGGDGNDFIWSYGGGDTINGGYGLDTLVFTENVSDFAITSSPGGGIIFSKGSAVYAATVDFENYRFGFNTASSKDISAAQLKTYIVDSAANISVTLTGTAKEDEQLGAKIAITDADGVGTYTLQWQSKTASGSWTDMAGKSNSYRSLTQSEVDHTIRAKVNYVDPLGHAQTAFSSATSTVLNVNDAPTGSVAISGKTLAGEVLTADTSTIKDEDGLGAFAYQWQRSSNGSKWDAITSANAVTYKLGDADAFHSLRVVVSYTDKYNTQEAITSSATSVVNPTNFAPTGAPTITLIGANPLENSAMTADISGVADRDGLGPFAYQWQKFINSAWASVPGAKNKTFTPTDAEVGLSLRVQMSFVDGRGNLESLYSQGSAAVQNVNDAPMGGIRLSGSHIEDATLSAESTLADHDGLGALTYQWQSSSNKSAWSNINGATTSGLKLTDAHVGLYLRMSAAYVDGHGTSEVTVSEASTQIRNINDAPGGAVLLAGLSKEDQTLTANASSLTDEDGLGSVTMQWQYESVTGAWTDIVGASGNTLTLGDAQVGKAIRATAKYTDLNGTGEIVASFGTAKVENINDAPTGSLIIDGKLALDSTLLANTAGISDSDGILIMNDGIYEIDAFSYQWQRSANGTIWSDIVDATEANYVLVAADMGQKLRVNASYVDLHGTLEQVTSGATTPVPIVNTSPVGAITISGTATEDMTLSLNTSSLSDADGLGALRFQWQRSVDSADWINIKSANASTYVLGDADVANYLRATVAYTDGRNTQEMVYSAATAMVIGVNDAPTGGVKVTGQFFQGGVVSADVKNLSDNDGLGELKYQWQRSTDGSTYKNIPAATQKNLELTKFDVDTQVRVIVSYKDGQGFRESIGSATSQKILDTNDAPRGLITVTGVATEDKVVALNTTGLIDDDGLGDFQYAWQASNRLLKYLALKSA